jgi:PRC-barrel domain
MKPLDSFTEDEARRIIGRRAVDVRGKKAGSLRRIWLDPSTYHVEFAGVRRGWLFPRTGIIPARDIEFDEERKLIRLEHPRAFISKGPHSNPKAELAEIEKEEIDAYYGYFVPLRRASDIKEIRPEDALDRLGVPAATATVDALLLHPETHEN